MADATSLEWEIQDDQGLKNRSQMYVAYDGTTETVDALIGVWTAYGALIDPCVDGMIVKGQITIPLVRNAAWKAAPVNPGNNVNQVMDLVFNNDYNTYATNILLPSYKESLLNTDKTPNLAETHLAALIAAIIAGETTAFPNSRDLHDLNALRRAFLTVRHLRGARQKLSTTP